MTLPDPVSLSDRFVLAVEKKFNDARICSFVNAPRDHHKNPSKKTMIDEICESFLQIAPLKGDDIGAFKSTVQDAMLTRASNMEFLYDVEAPMHALRTAFREMTIEAASKAAHKNIILRHGVSRVANDNRSLKLN